MLRMLSAFSFSAPTLALLTFASIGVGTLSGCSDENDPKTWVKKLNTPADRVAAIKRLESFYEDAVNNAATGDGSASAATGKATRDTPQVKALLDVIVDPMTSTYTSGDLDEKTRRELMVSLAGMRDPRTAPAFVKAFGTCDPTQGSEDAKIAATGVSGMIADGKTVDASVPDPLWACFTKLRASTKAAGTIQPVHDAILAVKSPSYGPKAVELLAAPVDMKNADGAKDQLQAWQLTAVQVIRDTKFTAGARPLVKVLLTPEKQTLWPLTESVLLSMPKDAEAPLIATLNGSDPELARMAATFDDKGYVVVAADALGWLSRPAGLAAIYTAIGQADNDTNRAALATSLIKFPNDGKSWAAFKAIYDKLPSGAPEQMGAKGKLASAASQFYDPAVVDWAVKEANGAKGDAASVLQIPALDTAIKLMGASQVAAVQGAAAPVAAFLAKNGTLDERTSSAYEKSAADAGAALVAKCASDAMCYAGVFDQPITSDPATISGPMKAAYMTVVTAGANAAAVRAKLVASIPKVKQPGVRLALVEAIDKLAPTGDTAAATALDAMVDTDKAAGDKNVLTADDSVAKVAMRLRSRATP